MTREHPDGRGQSSRRKTKWFSFYFRFSTSHTTVRAVPHTAVLYLTCNLSRRTGATLMYLAGMDIYDIMKITGHSTPMMLNKYIKADQLEVVEKITDKYDYSD